MLGWFQIASFPCGVQRKHSAETTLSVVRIPPLVPLQAYSVTALPLTSVQLVQEEAVLGTC